MIAGEAHEWKAMHQAYRQWDVGFDREVEKDQDTGV